MTTNNAVEENNSKFDVLIRGTGLQGSLLSAALALSGVSVLHVDEHYGGDHTGVQAKDFLSFLQSNSAKYKVLDCKDLKAPVQLELRPNLLYAKSEIIQLLIDSTVSRYLDFKLALNGYVLCEGSEGSDALVKIPLSKEDIFMDNSISLKEKRLLMKAITDRNFDGLPEKWQNVVKYGMPNLEQFVSSIGRYGKTPFLWTCYGTGELCQAFCRLSAVYGSVFIIGQDIPSEYSYNLTVSELGRDSGHVSKILYKGVYVTKCDGDLVEWYAFNDVFGIRVVQNGYSVLYLNSEREFDIKTIGRKLEGISNKEQEQLEEGYLYYSENIRSHISDEGSYVFDDLDFDLGELNGLIEPVKSLYSKIMTALGKEPEFMPKLLDPELEAELRNFTI